MQDLTISILQADIIWEDIPGNLKKIESKLEAVDNSTDLIILPEVFNTGFPVDPYKFAEKENGRTVKWMASIAREKNCVVTGSILIEENGKFYNRLIWMHPNGEYDQYSKRHVFTLGDEADTIQAGTESEILKLKDWNIKPLICYDLRFPVWAKNTYSEKGFAYDVLIYVANWPETRAFFWKQLLIARAIENQAFVIGVNRVGKDGAGNNYSGDTQIINPNGQIVSDFIENKEQLKTYTLSRQSMQDFRTKFNVGLDWDSFTID